MINFKTLRGAEKTARVKQLKKAYDYYRNMLTIYRNSDASINNWLKVEANKVVEELKLYGHHYNKF